MKDLEELYYNPKIGYVSLQKFYDIVKDHHLNYTYKQVKEWYDSQNINEIYKEPNVKPEYQSIRAVNNKVGTLQMDLMVVKQFSKANRGVKYLLNIIDIYSRYLWVFGINNKKAKTVEPFVREVLDYLKSRQDYDQIFMTCDNGTEFLGSVSKLFDEYNVKVYWNDPKALNAKRIMGIIERVNRTLWNRLKKYMYANDTLKYIDVLDQLVYSYNHTKHSTTKQKPYEIMYKNIHSNQIYNIIPKNVFKIGDKVRHLKKVKTFSKRAFKNKYSLKVYTIKDIVNNRYILNNDKVYDYYELIPANNDNDDSNNFGQQIKENDQLNKEIRLNEQDFKMKQPEIDNQILKSKRPRKITQYYIHT